MERHVPVMLSEVLDYLGPEKDSPLIVDGTLGEGGHSAAFLEYSPGCRVVGVDADAHMAERAAGRLSEWAGRFEARVGWTDEVLAEWQDSPPDAILMDLGVSTYHYEGRGKGFSFLQDEKLDMRLDAEEEFDAAHLVNTLDQDDLADLIYEYGEERFSRRIAARIVRERGNAPIETSAQLARIAALAIPRQKRHGRLHAATRTFQALRLAVNKELDHLKRFLELAPALLAENGRLGVISFQSLEDRIVKHRFRELDERWGGDFKVLTRKPLAPTEEEKQSNPPSRSAKFRVIEKRPKGGPV